MRAARRVREAVRGNGPVNTPEPRPRADFHDLQLEDSGFHYSVLRDFRYRRAEDGRADKLFTA